MKRYDAGVDLLEQNVQWRAPVNMAMNFQAP
jgi:hypothetical protein